MILLFTSIVLASCYLYWMSMVLRGWQVYIASEEAEGTHELSISIVIPFKDEAHNLIELLESIDHLDYPRHLVEIILVDDHSQDEGVALVNNWLGRSKFEARLIRSEENGKKAAQRMGVEASKNGIIACTDADCILSSAWLSHVSREFHAKDTHLVFGPVLLKGHGHAFQKIEFNSLIASTMGALGGGWPIMGNGANMSFRREAYLKINEHLLVSKTPSGDDVFFLHQIVKEGKKIGWLKSPNSVVYTKPQKSLNEFIDQRIRWASKARYYSHFPTILVGVLVLLTNLFLLGVGVAAFIFPTALVAFIVLFLIKVGSDYLLLQSHARQFSVKFSIGTLLFQELVNLFYVPMIAILSQIKGFTWKGRRY